MAVQTPQIDVPVYQEAEAYKTPIPQFETAQALPAGSGYASKGGQVAKIASDVLNGWMRGLQVKQEKQIRQASAEVGGADMAVKNLGQNYQQILTSNGGKADAPEAKAAFAAWTKAYNDSLDIKEKYVIPQKGKGKDGQPKKEGIKGKLDNTFQGILGRNLKPELLPELSIAAMRAMPPREGLSAESQEYQRKQRLEEVETKAAETQAAEAQMTLDEKKDAKAVQDKWKQLSMIPDDKLTPSQRQERALTEKVMLGPQTPDKQLLYGTINKIQSGEKLSDMERSTAYKSGLLEAPQVIQRVDNGKDVIQTISPDGKVLSTSVLGRHYEKDEAAAAIRIMNAQQKSLFNLYKQAQPGTPDEDVWKMVAADQSRSPYMVQQILGDSPVQAEKNAEILNKAIKRVWGEAGKGDEAAENRSKWSNFIVQPSANDTTGRYMFRTQVDPTGSTGFFHKRKVYAGGLDEDSLKTTAEAFRNRLKSAIRDENPKLTDQQIEKLIPPILQSPDSGQPSGGRAIGAPPSTTPSAWSLGNRSGPGSRAAATGDSTIIGSAGAGKKLYNVTASDGTTQAYLTDDQVKSVQAQGGQVEAAQ